MTDALKPVRFLMVDDLDENLLALEALLRRDGLACVKAKSGPEALELLLKDDDFGLALIDVQMPGMDGFELAEFMRGNERIRHIPIIFLTAGQADTQRRFKGYESGAVDFLQKPIEGDVLRGKASVFFDLHRQRQHVAHLLEQAQQHAVMLEELDRRKDEFLATLAHELRNPLAPIRNGLQILRMEHDDVTDTRVKDIMDRQLTHMVRLIDDLLDMSRITSGKIELRKDAITLQSAAQLAIETSKPLIETMQHTLTLNMPESDIWIDADLTRLAQIISNLLNNAAKYTPEGGKINLTIGVDGEQAMLTVSDNGIGVSRNMLDKIFELFTQVETSRMTQAQGGLGIGLALVRHLVGMHGGSIEAFSAGEGKGSSFTIRLPMIAAPAQQDPATPKPAEEQPSLEAGQLKILIVDDNLESARTTGWMMEIIGHEPILAHDGIEAVEAAKKERPDVILLDIGLPGKSGYDVCRELRNEPCCKDTLIVAQTGWGQKRDRELAQEAGFNHYLVKPVALDDISKLLEQYAKAG
jgi:signal transduction histidine kinase